MARAAETQSDAPTRFDCRTCMESLSVTGYSLSFLVTQGIRKKMEARVGFEPTSDGFADHSLRPLGYRAKQSSIANPARASVRAGRPFAQI